MDCAYKRTADKSFEETVGAVERSIADHGFSVSGLHDVQAALASKGFPIMPLRIYEIVDDGGAESHAKRWGSADVSLLMPCRIYVHFDQGRSIVTALKPTLMCQVFPEAGLDRAADLMESVVESLVDDAVA